MLVFKLGLCIFSTSIILKADPNVSQAEQRKLRDDLQTLTQFAHAFWGEMPKREPAVLNLFVKRKDYDAANQTYARGRHATPPAFSHLGSRAAYVLWSPRMRGLARHEAVHLLSYAAFPNVRAHTFFFEEGLAEWVAHAAFSRPHPRTSLSGPHLSLSQMLNQDFGPYRGFEKYVWTAQAWHHLARTRPKAFRTWVRTTRKLPEAGFSAALRKSFVRLMAEGDMAALEAGWLAASPAKPKPRQAERKKAPRRRAR